MSSWCQYEALKYVSFPTQVLAKAFIHSDLPPLTHSFIQICLCRLFSCKNVLQWICRYFLVLNFGPGGATVRYGTKTK
jgi:hypothetical protein